MVWFAHCRAEAVARPEDVCGPEGRFIKIANARDFLSKCASLFEQMLVTFGGKCSSLKCQRICCHEHLLGKCVGICSANARHMGARAETAGAPPYVRMYALGTKTFHSPPPLLRWGWPCGHFFIKKSCFGAVLGVFLALFWPTKACFGLNSAKIGPNTPPKHPQNRLFFFLGACGVILFFGAGSASFFFNRKMNFLRKK